MLQTNRIPSINERFNTFLIAFTYIMTVHNRRTSGMPKFDIFDGMILILLFISLKYGYKYRSWTVIVLAGKTQDIVVIYVWLPGESSFGHVSLEIKKCIIDGSRRGEIIIDGTLKDDSYMSVGPRQNPLPVSKYFKRNKIQMIGNYEDDVKDMKSEPDIAFYFYTLDTIPMQTAIKMLNKRIKKRRVCYGLLRNVNNTRRKPSAYTCVAAVIEVFHAGGGLSKLFGITEDKIFNCQGCYDGVRGLLSRTRRIILKLLSISLGISQCHAFEIYTTPAKFAQVLKQAKINDLIVLNGIYENDSGWLPWKEKGGNVFYKIEKALNKILKLFRNILNIFPGIVTRIFIMLLILYCIFRAIYCHKSVRVTKYYVSLTISIFEDCDCLQCKEARLIHFPTVILYEIPDG